MGTLYDVRSSYMERFDVTSKHAYFILEFIHCDMTVVRAPVCLLWFIEHLQHFLISHVTLLGAWCLFLSLCFSGILDPGPAEALAAAGTIGGSDSEDIRCHEPKDHRGGRGKGNLKH